MSVGFYLYGLILGILLISQFWTLANDVYDPRQAKRLFGLIGGGASLGGATGAAITATLVERLGTTTMLLVSAAHPRRSACSSSSRIVRTNEQAGQSDASKTGEEEGVSGGEALELLRGSRHLQIIALVITFAAIGAAIIEQQLNMATAEAKGQTNTDGITAFLAQITVYLSLIGLFIQVALTSRIHRLLGIGFALMILPVSLGGSGLLMLTVGALWTAGLARDPRHVAALHGRQDHARDPVPAVARRRQVPRQAVHRRHRRSVVEGRGRAADPGVDQGLGPRPLVAAVELSPA